MTFHTITIVSVALVLGAAGTASAQKKASGCGPDVYLNVQVSGTAATPNGYALVSDGIDQYNHGSSRNVVARFQVDNCTHDFTLNLNNTRRYLVALLSGGAVPSKFFNLDRVHSIPLTSDPNFFNSAFCTQAVVRNADGTILKNADGSYQDNYAGCFLDENNVSYVRRAGGVSLEPDARLGFNVSPVDRPEACPAGSTDPVCSASYIRAYHPSVTQWIVTSEPPALADHQVWVNGGTGYQSQGYQMVPFRIVANKQ